MKLEPLLDRAIVKPLEPIKSASGAALDSVQANVCEAEALWAAEGANVRVLCSYICGSELYALRVKCCCSEKRWRLGFSW
ncbi:10 kDa chaperonin [Candidatus Hodgkinia cicadicola]|nr:10 kDa chaperonin [Candidatus Hodgkinia cicadicola]